MIKHVTGAGKDTSSPYGDSWDLLWVGHCGDEVDYTHDNVSSAFDDTLPDTTLYRGVYGDYTYFPPHLRLVHDSMWPICTFAYAITRDAALRMYGLAKGGAQRVITVEMREWCLNGTLRCVTVNPELFHHHKKAGEIASQIAVVEGWDDRAAAPNIGYTANIRYSARCNSKSETLVTCQSEFGDNAAKGDEG
ncbi:uncharacterized protein VB005_00318 [Metarhizium brunneum]